MAAAARLCRLAALLSLVNATHKHSGETFRVSAGHLFLLKCPFAEAHTNLTWSREQTNLSLPSGVEIRDGFLWFLPAQMSHAGTYVCEKREESRLFRMEFEVLVSSGECPDPDEMKSVPKGVSKGLPCKQREIFKLTNTRNITWMKDCHAVERQGEPISVDKEGFMRLPAASEKDAGIYTCLVDISLNGRKYTSARSIQLTIDNGVENTEFIDPGVVFPQQEVVVVKVGARVELKCLFYAGVSLDNETLMYWTVNGSYPEDDELLHESWIPKKEGDRWFGESTLYISEVLRRFLNVPIRCNIMNPAGQNNGLVFLQEADHSSLYNSVALCLVASFVTLGLAAAFRFYKVDVVLVHRKLLRNFCKHQAPDVKLYDAYVSFLHPCNLRSAETASFALHSLPEKLEKQHGYSLYIRGRDDCPGEAIHDIIAATMQKCHRLIIILSAEAKSSTDIKTEDACALHEDQHQLCYEQKLGLYDALTQNNLRVILVEIDGPVDYSQLPESLRYVKRKQGALKWRTGSSGTSKSHSNKHFWKHLRYHMPSVPVGSRHTIV